MRFLASFFVAFSGDAAVYLKFAPNLSCINDSQISFLNLVSSVDSSWNTSGEKFAVFIRTCQKLGSEV